MIIALAQVEKPVFKQFISSAIVLVGMFAIFLVVDNWIEQKAQQTREEELRNQLKDITAGLSSIHKNTELIKDATVKPSDQWNKITTIDKASWLPYNVKALLLIFKSTSGVIKGNVRIEGSEQMTSFSTDINDTIPVAVENVRLPVKNGYQHFQHFPIIEYEVTAETRKKGYLTIIMVGVQLG